jgi:hypothetical protein
MSSTSIGSSSCRDITSGVKTVELTTFGGEIEIGRASSLSGVGVLEREGGGQELLLELLMLELPARSVLSFALSLSRSTEQGLTLLLELLRPGYQGLEKKKTSVNVHSLLISSLYCKDHDGHLITTYCNLTSLKSLSI